MTRLATNFYRFVLKHPFLIIAVFLALTTAAAFFVPKIQLDNTVDAFWDKKGDSYRDFKEWEDGFGDDRYLIIAFKDDNIFKKDNLELISRLTETLELERGIAEVTSLTNINDIFGYENDFIVQPFIEKIPSDPEELRALKQKALENPLYVKNVISYDATTAGLLVELESTPQTEGIYRRKLIEKIEEVAASQFPQDKEYSISGPSSLEYYYVTYVKEGLKVFLPIAFIVIITVILFCFRSAEGFFLPLVVIAISLIWAMCFLYFCGFVINSITTIAPVIILSVSLATGIHFTAESIQIRARSGTATSNKDSLEEIIKHLAAPCFMATLTTAVGFISLTVNRAAPVRELGMVVAAGVFFSYIITFIFIPAVIKQFNLFKPRGASCGATYFFRSSFDDFMKGIAGFNERYKIQIVAATVAIIIFSLWGLSRIKVETSLLDFFDKNTPFYKSTIFIEDNLSGTHFLEVSIKAGERDYFKDPKALIKIQSLQKFLSGIRQVDKTTSVVDYIKEINKSFHNEDHSFYVIPSSKRLVAQYLLLYGATDMDDYVDSEWQWITVQTRLNEHSTAELKKVIANIQRYLDENFPSPLEAKALGWPVMEVESNEATTDGQIQSLCLAMFIIFGMMFIVSRSIPVGLIAIVPNALPILINFGIMGILGIRLDSATAMISAVGIGIIVDDTIHFLHSFGREVKKDNDYAKAMERTLLVKGRPIVLTSVILFLGFSVLVFSKFVPIVYFGLLSATVMCTALLADLIVLPCLLLYFKPRFAR